MKFWVSALLTALLIVFITCLVLVTTGQAIRPLTKPPISPWQAKRALHSVWPKYAWRKLDCVVRLESGWDTWAIRSGRRVTYRGLLQIASFVVTQPVRLHDPVYTAYVSYGLYVQLGWRPWRATASRCEA